MKIVFMGTPGFAVASLEKIIGSKHTVVSVVTVPDKPAGRNRMPKFSEVKQCALRHELPLLQPPNLKDSEFIDSLKALAVDVIFVVAFRKLPKEVWSLPRFGTINLHGSLLPKYRGAAPINWAIINGETKTGVTTFFINEKIDEGQLILKKEMGITHSDNFETVHDNLQELGADLVLETLEIVSENTKTQAQDLTKEFPLAPKLSKENTQINWSTSLTYLQNFIRGLSPYPACWTRIKINGKEQNMKLFASTIQEQENPAFLKKLEIRNKELVVVHPQGFLFLLEIQLENKKRMPVASFLNGIPKNSVIELVC